MLRDGLADLAQNNRHTYACQTHRYQGSRNGLSARDFICSPAIGDEKCVKSKGKKLKRETKIAIDALAFSQATRKQSRSLKAVVMRRAPFRRLLALVS